MSTPARRFAEGTSVAPEKTKAEIEKLVRANGATSFASAQDGDRVRIQFALNARFLRFDLKMPSSADVKAQSKYRWAAAGVVEKVRAAEERRLFRALLLGIKAKLELSTGGIESFEEVFLANIVTPDGSTIGEHIVPRVAEIYASGRMPAGLLGAGGVQ